ncbi:hypothetical protein [Streptomyces sp. ME18-1-4]|uniref:hypothetical protein n=1 Tax=Streptomyces sp. ME18-1-4 TaxID=3028685 RepID=UPI0029B3B425|nr:hypothetical protein [Streptomyces sp. ME18-1-4]MDX3247478.1 hypothetical protein [Streptomyces sp. ME18-1-4]
MSVEPVTLTVVDTTTAQWEKFPVPQINAELDALPLIAVPDTGMHVMKLVYRGASPTPGTPTLARTVSTSSTEP